MSLDIKITKNGDHSFTLNLAGSIVPATHERLEQQIDSLISDETKAIFLDMSQVDYISSIGIKSVLISRKKLEKQNANLVMTNIQPQVKKVFDVMNLLPIFEIFDEMPDADNYIDQIIKEEMQKTKQ